MHMDGFHVVFGDCGAYQSGANGRCPEGAGEVAATRP
jgi:hypothetical protein